MSNMAKTWLVLLILLLPALLLGLGNRPLHKIQEVRIAETAREMVTGGDWLVPKYNGELRLQKPPLPYWLTAVSYRLAGISETAARLPAALFGMISAWLLLLWVGRESGARMAANTALILVASYLGIRYFRSGEADAILLFFICAACMQGYRMVQQAPRSHDVMLFYLALGLGFLTKGPAGIVIPLLALTGYAVLEKRLQALKQCLHPPAIVLMLAVGTGWYVWILWALPDAAQYFFGREVDETFISGTHAKPFWWYFAHMFEFFAPWGLLLIPATVWAYRVRPLPPLARFALVWLGVVVVLLMLTVNKQMQYALLLLPPVAIFLAHYLQLAKGWFDRLNRWLFWLACAAFAAALLWTWRKVGAGSVVSPLWLILVLPLLAKRLLKSDAPATPVLLVASLTLAAYLYGEQYLSKEPDKIEVRSLMSKAAHYQPLYQTRPGDGAVSYYAGRIVPPLEPQKLPEVLKSQTEIWLVAPQAPKVAGVQATATETEGELVLWKITRAP